MPKNKDSKKRRNPINRKLMKNLEARMEQFRGFGDLALFLREQQGITRNRLACEMGYTHGYAHHLKALEESNVLGSPALLRKYSEFFHINPKIIADLDDHDLERLYRSRQKGRRLAIVKGDRSPRGPYPGWHPSP